MTMRKTLAELADFPDGKLLAVLEGSGEETTLVLGFWNKTSRGLVLSESRIIFDSPEFHQLRAAIDEAIRIAERGQP